MCASAFVALARFSVCVLDGKNAPEEEKTRTAFEWEAHNVSSFARFSGQPTAAATALLGFPIKMFYTFCRRRYGRIRRLCLEIQKHNSTFSVSLGSSLRSGICEFALCLSGRRCFGLSLSEKNQCERLRFIPFKVK